MSARASCIAAALILTGCAGMSEQACLTSDWRTVGFEDGAAGRSAATIGNYRQACSKHGVSPDLDGYRAGHAEGVEIYCRPNRGFDVGRSGAAYQGVCPVDVENEFLEGYNAGRQLYELESAVRRAEARIASNRRQQEQIKAELADITATIASSETSAEDRIRLVARAAELGDTHGELSSEISALEQERAVHQVELDEYRQTLAFGF